MSERFEVTIKVDRGDGNSKEVRTERVAACDEGMTDPPFRLGVQVAAAVGDFRDLFTSEEWNSLVLGLTSTIEDKCDILVNDGRIPLRDLAKDLTASGKDLVRHMQGDGLEYVDQIRESSLTNHRPGRFKSRTIEQVRDKAAEMLGRTTPTP